ncbi:hypothetical protein [Streptomyces sp. NPDC047869]|uniref:hypothetical protein n=1 Tax=Streptomyces sp. NPDC047869 TaxID=3154709 RepID=UPI0034537170
MAGPIPEGEFKPPSATESDLLEHRTPTGRTQNLLATSGFQGRGRGGPGVGGFHAKTHSADQNTCTAGATCAYRVAARAEPDHSIRGCDSLLDDALYQEIESRYGLDIAEGVDYNAQRMHDGTANSLDHEIPGIGHNLKDLAYNIHAYQYTVEQWERGIQESRLVLKSPGGGTP